MKQMRKSSFIPATVRGGGVRTRCPVRTVVGERTYQGSVQV
jgi:hypothetical protein